MRVMARVRPTAHPIEFWNYKRLFREVLVDRETTITWCKRYGLLATHMNCPQCGTSMHWESVNKSDGYRYDMLEYQPQQIVYVVLYRFPMQSPAQTLSHSGGDVLKVAAEPLDQCGPLLGFQEVIFLLR